MGVGTFFGIGYMVALTLLLSLHIFFICNNLTTLEVLAIGFRSVILGKLANNPFDLGTYNNFCAIFGKDVTKWFLPVFSTEGDGCTYPVQGLF